MDFVMGFPKIVRQHDEIMVVVDKLRKETHFIPIKSISRLYMLLTFL